MNRFKQFLLMFLVMFTVAACDTSQTSPLAVLDSENATAFDEFGYNEIANIFNGPADGVDKMLDGKVWGDPTYANDHLVMKWNKAWENCNANRSPETCAGAWTMNEWNGNVSGGSGESWHYKFKWVGTCGATGASLPDGSYCIWNEYAVVMSHGTVDNQHFWDAHARPNGFGN